MIKTNWDPGMRMLRVTGLRNGKATVYADDLVEAIAKAHREKEIFMAKYSQPSKEKETTK